jgi:glycosyltransferase involved in cell wall biosynthesis
MSSVSIILPTYNRPEFLTRAVESALAQSFGNWDLVIVDDGSAEETTAYLRGLESPRVRVLYLAHTGNPSRVRNAGLAVAKGRYVAFLDSDDVWSVTKLEKQVAALGASPQSRWSYTACDRIDASGNRLPTESRARATRGGWIFEPLLALEVTVAMPTVVAERSLLEEVGGFDEAQLYGEFHDLVLRLALRSEAVALPEQLCSVRAHDQHYSADRAAAHRSWMRLYAKFHSLAPTAAARDCCERMRARAALDLARLQGAKQDFQGVWRTLRSGRVWSWRRPSFWYGYSLALLRPFMPTRLRLTRVRPPRQRGAVS